MGPTKNHLRYPSHPAIPKLRVYFDNQVSFCSLICIFFLLGLSNAVFSFETVFSNNSSAPRPAALFFEILEGTLKKNYLSCIPDEKSQTKICKGPLQWKERVVVREGNSFLLLYMTGMKLKGTHVPLGPFVPEFGESICLWDGN